MAQPLVIGIDSSTQSTKAEARNLETGERVGLGRAHHPPTSPPCSQQDPQSWWIALVGALGQLGDLRAEVVAISVAGQQHGLVVTDSAGHPLRPAKLWNDTESAPQAAELVRALGATRWADECGSVPVAAFTVTKLAWLVEAEPDLLGDIGAVGLPHDWLTRKLSGRHVTDRGDASGTGWYDASADPAAAGVRPDLLAAAVQEAPGGLADPAHWADLLPEVLSASEPAGTILPDVARELGLPESVLVGPGTGDNMAAALGLGLGSGDVAFSLGTSGTVYSVAASQTSDPSGAVAGFADASGQFLPLVCTLNATKVTDTVAQWLGADLDEMAALALAADPHEGTGPTLVPYFDGERTPDLPDATGSLTGLRNETSRESISLAAHDGVLGGLIAGRDALRASGVPADGRVFLVGGGARSAAYRTRLAELLGCAVRTPAEDESVAAGAALQAAVVADESDTAAAHAGPEAFAEVADRWNLGAGSDTEPR
ncbi:MAG: xylulokinase [Microthrixaceae bacterium]